MSVAGLGRLFACRGLFLLAVCLCLVMGLFGFAWRGWRMGRPLAYAIPSSVQRPVSSVFLRPVRGFWLMLSLGMAVVAESLPRRTWLSSDPCAYLCFSSVFCVFSPVCSWCSCMGGACVFALFLGGIWGAVLLFCPIAAARGSPQLNGGPGDLSARPSVCFYASFPLYYLSSAGGACFGCRLPFLRSFLFSYSLSLFFVGFRGFICSFGVYFTIRSLSF